jgi:anti-anti-sigma factor
MPAEPGLPSDRLSVTVHGSDRQVRLVAVGEIDLNSVDRFTNGLQTGLEMQPLTLTVDLAGVTFMDSTGVNALVQYRNRADEAGLTLTVVNCQPLVRRVLDMTGVLPWLTTEG